jgi:hypothetical protein
MADQFQQWITRMIDVRLHRDWASHQRASLAAHFLGFLSGWGAKWLLKNLGKFSTEVQTRG